MVYNIRIKLYVTILNERNLFAEQDFAASADVLASLGRALVCAGLQANDCLASVQLFFCEFTLILVSWFWSEVWSIP